MRSRVEDATDPKPSVPSHPAPQAPMARSAPPRKILEASLVGVLGLVAGLVPLALSALIVQVIRREASWDALGSEIAIPVGVAGFLFAGMCAGFAAAWRLRSAGKRGRRAAGQLSILFAEAVVVLVILLRNPVPRASAGCSLFCFPLDQVLGMLALIGWPIAAVGALIGAALEKRRETVEVTPAQQAPTSQP